MSKKATRDFKVEEFDEENVWFELREGNKRGLQFAIPLDKGCKKDLESLEPGDNITATLSSLNDKNTKWECVSFEKE